MLPDIKLSEKDSTDATSGGYFYIILPNGSGGWISRRVSMTTLRNEFIQSNTIVKGFTNSSLDGSFDLVIITPSCIAYEITIQKPDGTQFVAMGMAEKTSLTQIKVHFGETIESGQWYYILKYYTTTT